MVDGVASTYEALDEEYPGAWAHRLIPAEPHSKACRQTSWGRLADGRSATGDRSRHLASMAQHVDRGGNLGFAAPSGVVILDADDAASAAALTRAGGISKPSPRADGGAHIFFSLPDGAEITNTCELDLGNGIKADVRGHGAMVLVWPSIHPETGKRYEPMEWPDQFPPIPDYLLEKLTAPVAAVSGLRSWNAPIDDDTSGPPIAEGSRDRSLYRIACKWRGMGHSHDEIEASLLDLNAKRCEPPLESWQVRKIAKSACKHPPGLSGAPPVRQHVAAEPLGDAIALNELASGSELLLPIVQESKSCDTDPKLNELARLSRIEYDRCREGEAKILGIRVSTLDAEVTSRRPDPSEKASTGTAVLFAEAEPWPEPVDGEKLLYSLAAGYKRFLALPEWSAETMALWTLAAHAHDLSQISPILAFVSPEKRCGKTTALGLLNLTCPRPLPASNITGAALFRSVEKWRPTLLVDEADTFLRDSDELRGIFNSGHNRSQAVVIRTAGEDYEPRVYSTWSPKVIAMIGSLPGTLEDRAISIPMRRRRSDERVEKFRADRNYGLGDLARQCARWVQDNSDDLRESDPEIPRSLHDRACDNWRALIAIADVAGGDWPETARKAAEALTPTEDESSIGTLLLTDIRDIYCDRDGPEWISSRELCEALVGLSDRAWSEIQRGGKSLTTTGLARRLKPFKVRPVQHKNSEKNARGYLFADFQEPFGRYLPTDAPASPCPSATPLPSNENRYLADSQPLPTVDGSNGGSGWESSNPAESLKGSGVALGHPEASEDKRDEWGEV